MPRAKKKEELTGLKRKELLAVLEKLRPGLASKDVIEQATHFVFADGFVWSFNDEIAVSHPLPTGLTLEGAVPAEPLLKLLSKSAGEIVALDVVEGELRVKCGRSNAGIALAENKLPVSDIPMPEEKDWCDLPEGFLKAVALARLSASHDTTTPVLTCVNVTSREVTGCDNFRITEAYYDADAKAWPEQFLLPISAAVYLKAFEPEAVAAMDGWAHFINGDDVVMSCRTGSGEYPDLTRLLDVSGDAVELPKELVDALDRAGVFAEAEFEQDEEVALKAEGKLLEVSAKGSHGWIKEELALAATVKKYAITVNPAILREALKLSNTVTISDAALLIAGKNFKHVVSLM